MIPYYHSFYIFLYTKHFEIHQRLCHTEWPYTLGELYHSAQTLLSHVHYDARSHKNKGLPKQTWINNL